MEVKLKDLLNGKEFIYDRDCQSIFHINKDDHMQRIVDIRGWGGIQQLFLNKKGELTYDAAIEAAKFQDKLGEFIAEALNEKLKTIE